MDRLPMDVSETSMGHNFVDITKDISIESMPLPLILFLLPLSVLSNRFSISNWSDCPQIELGSDFRSIQSVAALWNRWSPFLRFRHIECQSHRCSNPPESVEQACNLDLLDQWPTNASLKNETDSAEIFIVTPPTFSDRSMTWNVSQGSILEIRWNWYGAIDHVSVLLLSLGGDAWPIPVSLEFSNFGFLQYKVPHSVPIGLYKVMVHSDTKYSAVSGTFRVTPGDVYDLVTACKGKTHRSEYEVLLDLPLKQATDSTMEYLLRAELASVLETDAGCVSITSETVRKHLIARVVIDSQQSNCDRLMSLWNSFGTAHSSFQSGLASRRIIDIASVSVCNRIDNTTSSTAKVVLVVATLAIAPTICVVLALNKRFGIRQLFAAEGKEEETERDDPLTPTGMPIGILQDGKGKFFPFSIPIEHLWDTDKEKGAFVPHSPRGGREGRIIKKSLQIVPMQDGFEGDSSAFSGRKYLATNEDEKVLESANDESSTGSTVEPSPLWDLP